MLQSEFLWNDIDSTCVLHTNLKPLSNISTRAMLVPNMGTKAILVTNMGTKAILVPNMGTKAILVPNMGTKAILVPNMGTKTILVSGIPPTFIKWTTESEKIYVQAACSLKQQLVAHWSELGIWMRKTRIQISDLG